MSALDVAEMERRQEMHQADNASKNIDEAMSEPVIDKVINSDDDYDLFAPLPGGPIRQTIGKSVPDHNTPACQQVQASDLPMTSTTKRAHAANVTVSGNVVQLVKELHQLRKDFGRVCRELRVVSRENRDQSLELRDLKKANALSQERNSQLRDQNWQLRAAIRARGGEKLTTSEKVKYHERFERLEEDISRLQYERQKREADMEFLTEQTRGANEEKSSIESECRKLQRQVRELSANLTECKDDLLGLQPTNQISDSEICEHYYNLDQQIQGWVDDKTEDSQILEDQIDKIKQGDDLPVLFRDLLSNEHLRMARNFPESQPILIRYLVHRVLGNLVFDDNIYLFGLDSCNIALLKSLEEGMKLLEPRRDAATLRRWRSESLQSLLQMSSLKEEQERQAQLLSRTLQSAISDLIFDSPADSEEGWQDLHKQVILPAIQLSTKLRLSTADYKFISHLFYKESYHAGSVFTYEIKDFTMIDITSHKIIRPDSVLKVAQDGRIGEEKLIISPALLRMKNDGKGKVLVCKPNVLVKLDEPMGRRNIRIKALGAWTPSLFEGDDAA